MNIFGTGQIVAYCPKDISGEIYKVEIGKVKSCYGETTAVYYSEGGTAARTPTVDLYPIVNAYAIKETFNSMD